MIHEVAIKYESELKTLLVLLDLSVNNNMGSPRYLHFRFCQMIYLFKTFTMLRRVFHLCGSLLSYDLSKISAKLVISLKHNIIFAKFLEILLDNNVTSLHPHIIDKAKITWKLFEFIFSNFLLTALSHQNVFKNALENLTRIGFR